jgi:hypothetical protein
MARPNPAQIPNLATTDSAPDTDTAADASDPECDEARVHHVTRIDIEPTERFPARHPTHGWQVRLRRDGERHTKFFADARHGGRDGALEAAVAYRDLLLAEASDAPPRPRRAWSNTGVVGLSVREKDEGGEMRPYVQINWIGDDGKRRAASYSVGKWGLRRALWNGCLRLYRERQAAGAPVEPPHVMFARAQEPFIEQIHAEQAAEARIRNEAAAEAKFASPEQQLKREEQVMAKLEKSLFAGLG